MWDFSLMRWDLAKRLELLTANAKVAIVLGSILVASSDTDEYKGRQMMQCGIKYLKIPLWCFDHAESEQTTVIRDKNTKSVAGFSISCLALSQMIMI